MGAPVVHFEIMSGEGVDLGTFYGELFGWKIDSNNPMRPGSSTRAGRRAVSTASSASLMMAGSVFRYMPRSAIYKQRSIGRRNSAARQSSRQPKCLAALSWPCSPIQPATSLDSFWGQHANGQWFRRKRWL